MLGKGEHVHRLDFLDSVTAADKVVQIALEGFGVAGDVDYLLGRGLDERIEETLVTVLTPYPG